MGEEFLQDVETMSLGNVGEQVSVAEKNKSLVRRIAEKLLGRSKDEVGPALDVEDVISELNLSFVEDEEGWKNSKNIHSRITRKMLNIIAGEKEKEETRFIEPAQPDDPHEVIPEQMSHEELKEVLPELLSSLTKREAEVVRMRYGLGNRDGMWFEDIARELGIRPHARVWEIHNKAIRKLRHPLLSRRLRTFYFES